MKPHPSIGIYRTLLFILLIISIGTAAYPEGSPSSAEETGKTAAADGNNTIDRDKYNRLLGHDGAGTAAYNKNDFITAQKEFLKSIALSVELFGENSGQTAHRCNSMALSCYHQGEYDRAIE